MTTKREEQVVNLLKAIETKNIEALSVIDSQTYTQHNLMVADGLEGFKGFIQSLPDGFASVLTKRIFEDGDYVVAHSEIEIGVPRAVFDIFRFEGDKIVEHWDAAQELAPPNPSGRTLLDGQENVSGDDASLEDNKRIAKGFVENVLMAGDLSKAGDYIGDKYLQHHPLVRDGLGGLIEAFAQWQAEGIEVKYGTIHKVLGKGDFVLIVTEGVFNGDEVAFYDMFRLEGGGIVEHWDVVEAVLPRDQWQNSNGKF